MQFVRNSCTKQRNFVLSFFFLLFYVFRVVFHIRACNFWARTDSQLGSGSLTCILHPVPHVGVFPYQEDVYRLAILHLARPLNSKLRWWGFQLPHPALPDYPSFQSWCQKAPQSGTLYQHRSNLMRQPHCSNAVRKKRGT